MPPFFSMTRSPNTILALAHRHGLTLEPDSLQINESGLDFLGSIAQTPDGTSWLLRIPRRPDVLASAQREQTILNLVCPHLPVEVPDWQIHSDELIAYPLLRGKPAATIDPEQKAYRWEIDAQDPPPPYLASLSQALGALHSIEGRVLAEAGLSLPSMVEIRTSWAERMVRVKAAYPVNPHLWHRWQRWLDSDALWPEHPALVHGDLHPGHILVDDQAQVTGLIDWTEAQIGDPAVDFVGHYLVFGRASLEALLSHYRRSGGTTWPAMADQVVEHSCTMGMGIAEFAERSGLEDFTAMARQVLSSESGILA
jgi:macrolide phosphotransferase